MVNSLIQFRVEEKIKKDATKIYEDIGLDLNTAIKLFLKKSIKMKTLPFAINDNEVFSQRRIDALNELDNMNININTSDDYRDEIYKGIKEKYYKY